jgi:hypothetical protein
MSSVAKLLRSRFLCGTDPGNIVGLLEILGAGGGNRTCDIQLGNYTPTIIFMIFWALGIFLA